jgi:hypothetical protein
MTDHPITPPPELIEDWIEIAKPEPWKRPPDPNVLCTLAAQWGADQELEACCEWLAKYRKPILGADLRFVRRPKPPSLKERALAVIENSEICDHLSPEHAAILRRALEQLDD